ncbi:hypothetical protein BGY98DRAFT_994679 [Russula aff. rugulosa BPL654]|nr:hypothetical protein BGY98DRAFT_994679 [Russula aff. rugulosa BPL654]
MKLMTPFPTFSEGSLVNYRYPWRLRILFQAGALIAKIWLGLRQPGLLTPLSTPLHGSAIRIGLNSFSTNLTRRMTFKISCRRRPFRNTSIIMIIACCWPFSTTWLAKSFALNPGAGIWTFCRHSPNLTYAIHNLNCKTNFALYGMISMRTTFYPGHRRIRCATWPVMAITHTRPSLIPPSPFLVVVSLHNKPRKHMSSQNPEQRKNLCRRLVLT